MSRSVTIRSVDARDFRFPLQDGSGTDAVHTVHEYAFAATRLCTDCEMEGSGFALTLGRGNEVVCQIISWLGETYSDCSTGYKRRPCRLPRGDRTSGIHITTSGKRLEHDGSCYQ